MLFSSITFLYYFLPCVVVLYFLTPEKGKNTILLLVSLFFYAWGEPKYVFVMISEILFGYFCGIMMERFRGKTMGKLFLGFSVLGSLGTLGYFKYMDFFLENITKLTGRRFSLLHIALPIGISFYTFQLLSYTIDVYRQEARAQKNLFTLATYVALFPQLIAGPIVRYVDVEKQLREREHRFSSITLGSRRFVIGLAKKVLIANEMGEWCSIFQASDDKSLLFCWMYAIAYTLQIYYDFSGYSDMAIGLGKIFGFDFMENFSYPYVSGSITEFWRRWHISLGSWFRDYVYIPLGGNRTTKIKWFRNIFIVWALTGFWHGASWNFVLWGLYFAILLVIEKIWLLPYLKKAKIWNHIYVMLLIILSFVIFGMDSIGEIAGQLKGMLGVGVPFVSKEAIYYGKSYLFIFVIACIGVTPAMKHVMSWLEKNKKMEKLWNIVEVFGITGLLLVITAYLVDASFNPFLYFRF